MFTTVTIDNRSARMIAAGQRWLPTKSVIGRKPRFGGIAEVVTRSGDFICMAFLLPSSRCYLRVFSIKKENADLEYWKKVISKAYARRKTLLDLTNSFRVVHSDSDGIPSTVIDKYDDVFVIQTTSEAADQILDDIKDSVVQLFAPKSVVERNDIAIREKEGLPLKKCFLFGGESVADVVEGDQRFSVDAMSGQKTGAYLDYRGFRMKGREFACGDCLDAFCYQGWFSCQIADAAESVISVDGSAEAISAAKENAKRNGHGNIDFIKADVFDYLASSDRLFDFIHLDPPSFAKGSSSVAQAAAGYRKLLRLALPHLKSRGVMMVSSCSHSVTERILEASVASVFAEKGLEFSVIFRGIQDRDHPVMKSHPESLYLKALAVRLCK